MSPLPIRTRIAPIALVIAFAFVVVGFLRADREMVRAGEERAALLISETATLVEAFMWRELERVRSTSRLLASGGNNGLVSATLPTAVRQSPDFDHLESLFITDSMLNIRTAFIQKHSAQTPKAGENLRTVLANEITDQIQSLPRNRTPVILTGLDGLNRRIIVFADPSVSSSNTILVATTTTDSLSAVLRQRLVARTVGVVIRSGTANVLELPLKTSRIDPRRIEQPISLPFSSEWNIEMTYLPSSRGVQIALWVVGLGAIVGLGIGLVLERREATRIADRSSELEHLSTELLRANRAKSEFLANVSHELRTPLNAIVGFVDLLRDGVYGALNARQVGPVERIEASATHLRHLVDQVLDLAKMAAGRLEVHAEPIELRPFVFDVASEVEPLITEKGLGFSLAVGASLPRVRTDPTHLRQILINLLGNAVKFTSNGGISIRGKLVGGTEPANTTSALDAVVSALTQSPMPNGRWIALQVADSGVGIPEKDRERIFDEFEQVNAGPRGDSMRRGTGLGLSISRRLARLLGGDITVESELGRGSVFTLWLPVNPADLQTDQAA